MAVTKHNEARTPLYYVWAQMKGRCFNPNNPEYKNYGARGITVCPEWLESTAFLRWAHENGYRRGLSIDRVNVNGNYEPGNCRWCDTHVQNANKRRLQKNRSGTAGVFKLKGNRSRPWQVDVGKHRVGYCATYEEAVALRKAYILDHKLTEYYGSIFI